MMRKYILFLLSAMVIAFSSNASQDSIILSYESFSRQVQQHHPVAVQANLQQLYGEASLLTAKGGFDPKLFAEVRQKYFDGDQYYHLGGGGLMVPTWFGVELKGGYEQNQGVYLNPEQNTPNAGLWYLGISVPLGQGLLIDERRTQLKQAQTFGQITQVEQQLMLNELQWSSGKVYWDWFARFHTLKVYQEALDLARDRYEAIRQGVLFGDRPPIDTIEAGIQVQNRQLVWQEARLQWNNASAFLESYLWADGVVPLELGPRTVPESFDRILLEAQDSSLFWSDDSLLANHPALKRSQLQIQQMELDRRLKKEQLKPDVRLKYNPIAEASSAGIGQTYSVSNYTWGLSFSMPVFLRKERGTVQLMKLKIQEAELKMSYQNANLAYQVNASVNEWNTNRQQALVYEQNVEDYRTLLDGERQLFGSGESSLFMVNAREVGYIGARIKWIEVIAKGKKAALRTRYTLGVLSRDFQ